MSRAEQIARSRIISRPYTVGKSRKLRNLTNVGDLIKFRKIVRTEDGGISRKSHEVFGIVTKIYPNMFQLEDGKLYTWNDYLMGFIY